MRNLFILSALVFSSATWGASVNPSDGMYTFSGPVEFAGLGQNFSCNLSLTGEITTDASENIVIKMEEGSFSGDFFSACSLIVPSFPWRAELKSSDLDIDSSRPFGFVFSNVAITVLGSKCSDKPSKAAAMFTNGDPVSKKSSLFFNSQIGSCAFRGSLEAKEDVNLVK